MTTPLAVILAAGVGSRIRPLTDDCPKTLLPVGGTTILDRMLTGIEACGLERVVIVLGYLGDRIEAFVKAAHPELDVEFVVNDRYAETNTAYSLMLVADLVATSGFVKFDGDVVFDTEILRRLLSQPDGGNYLCVDRHVQLDAEEVKVTVSSGTRVDQVSKSVRPEVAIGESIGIERISAGTTPALFAALHSMMADASSLQEYYEGAYERLIADGATFDIVDITGLAWTEIDTRADFDTAEGLFAGVATPR